MVKLPEAGKLDGTVRLWINGKLVSEHTDVPLFHPDHTGILMNLVFLAPYFHPGLPKDQLHWADQIVVATKYIGPVATKKAVPKKDKPSRLVARAADDGPLAKHAKAVTAAEKLARSGEVNDAASAYRKIIKSVSETDKLAGERLAVRVEGLDARKKLLRLIVKGVESLGAKSVYIDVFGRGERVKIVKADEHEGTFRLKGSRMPIAWPRMSHRRLTGIAAKYAQSAADHLIIAQYLVACGDRGLARAAIDNALAMNPNKGDRELARRIGNAVP